MNWFTDAGKKALSVVDAVGKADPQVIALVESRLKEQDNWNDLFSTKLIELLDKNDSVRSEIKERLDQIASASRAQKELVRAAEEYRAFSSEYEAARTFFNHAGDKFAEAEKIKISAAELRATASDYKNAEGRLEHARLLHEEASKKYGEAKQVLVGIETRAQQIVSDVKGYADTAIQARNLSVELGKRAEEQFSSANTFLKAASKELATAKSEHTASFIELRTARTEHDQARADFQSAKGALESARSQCTDAQSAATKASDDHRKAEGLVNHSEQLLKEATEKSKAAECSLSQAQETFKRAVLFATVALMAALSVAIWGTSQAISTGRYIALVPLSFTVLAVGFGVYALRKPR